MDNQGLRLKVLDGGQQIGAAKLRWMLAALADHDQGFPDLERCQRDIYRAIVGGEVSDAIKNQVRAVYGHRFEGRGPAA